MRTSITFAALILLSTPLLAVQVSFKGEPPAALGSREVKIDPSVVPWEEPVVIDYPDAATAVVRLAKPDEDPTPAKPFFRFEWTAKDKSSAKLFPITPQAEIDRMRKANDASIATAEGRAQEENIIAAFTNKYTVISKCIAGDKDLPEAITMYVTVTPGQPQATALVVPESSVADCVLNATDRGTYPAVKVPTTARDRIALAR
jgi:hypothetical protein